MADNWPMLIIRRCYDHAELLEFVIFCVTFHLYLKTAKLYNLSYGCLEITGSKFVISESNELYTPCNGAIYFLSKVDLNTDLYCII